MGSVTRLRQKADLGAYVSAIIKKLQRKFIFIATLSVFFVMLAIIGGINLANFFSVNSQIDQMLAYLTENDGKFPSAVGGGPSGVDGLDKLPENGRAESAFSEESRYMTRYFIVRADRDVKILQLDTGHIAALTSSGAQKLAVAVLESGKKTGYTGVYKFLVTDRPYGRLAVFLDCRERLSAAGRVLAVSLAIGTGGLVVVFILISVFSRRAVGPVVESIEKQRRFVTDASHELKTPLTIIAANADVLGYSCGENEWLASIRNQTKRLGGLIGDLLTLAKFDEESNSVPAAVFSLDAAVREAVGPYEAVAITKGYRLISNIKPSVGCRGNEPGIKRVISVLFDNAFKYAGGEGRIEVSLSKRGRYALLEVFNTVEGAVPDSFDRLFDRFYRDDASRSRDTGGYGLGLSIAKSIVEAGKGSITVKKRGGGIVFTVALPCAQFVRTPSD